MPKSPRHGERQPHGEPLSQNSSIEEIAPSHPCESMVTARRSDVKEVTAPRQSKVPVLDPETGEPMSLEGETIIAIDDDRENMKLFGIIISNVGGVCHTASNAQEGISKLLNAPPNAIALIDYFLPQTNGDAIARQIRIERPDIKLIVVTGFSSEVIDTSPFDSYVSKPFKMETLVKGILNAIRQQ